MAFSMLICSSYGFLCGFEHDSMWLLIGLSIGRFLWTVLLQALLNATLSVIVYKLFIDIFVWLNH